MASAGSLDGRLDAARPNQKPWWTAFARLIKRNGIARVAHRVPVVSDATKEQTMRNFKLRPLTILAAAALCTTALAGCPRQGEGPAERVGKTMDKGVSAVGRGVEKTGDAIEDAAEGR
jgi:hypothetical protein